ncbi:MAG: NAD(P)H-dependent glycerol-3-phosphate dehydrogenase [Alphaproteobacteria bacterium]
MKKVAFIGGGAWGGALAIACANAGRDVIVWDRSLEVVASINNQKRFPAHPDVILSNKISATNNIENLKGADAFFITTSIAGARDVLAQMKDIIGKKPVVMTSKGLELSTGLLAFQVAQEFLGETAKIALLAGPNFAHDIARGKISTTVIFSKQKAISKALAEAIACDFFRPYQSTDIIGGSICGVVKNIIAIAAGISDGMGLGENARAAIITRGLAEMSRLVLKMGGKKETVMGLAGVGDLFLTASSMKSRNYSLGFGIGQGQTVEEIMATRSATTEGLLSASAIQILANKFQIEMPLSTAVNTIVSSNISPTEIVKQLMTRPLKKEQD